MLVIRFNRVGRKNYAQYRIVVQEKTKAPGGRHVKIVGSYDPHRKVSVLKKNEIETFLKNGAQPSDSVYNLLVREGIIKGEKRKKKIKHKEVEEVEDKKEESTGIKEDKKQLSNKKYSKEYFLFPQEKVVKFYKSALSPLISEEVNYINSCI